MPQVNNLVVPKHRIAFFCIPKCANASVKQVFRDAFGKVGFWTKEQIARRKDWLTLAIVRDPFERALSTWAHKVRELGPEETHFKYGEWFDLGMPFRAFCERLTQIPDDEIDVHFQSQSHMIELDGRIVPDYLLPFEGIAQGWAFVRGLVYAHSGVSIARLPAMNRTTVDRSLYRKDDIARELIRDRYEDDYMMIGRIRWSI